MTHLLLAIIYLAFISLGLPDALLGAAWPSMWPQFGVPISYMGAVSLLISAGTVVSSLLSDRLTRRFGTGRVTCVSVALSAVGLFGFAISSSYWQLCLWAIPYGLGAGSVDASLNNYVAIHYASRHMSWLHCMWGLGASVGPYIMGAVLTGGQIWNFGYLCIGAVQVLISLLLVFTLPMWKKTQSKDAQRPVGEPLSIRQIFRLPGLRAVMLTFFCYCGLEQMVGQWASSYLVAINGMPADMAASCAGLFYAGITVGRAISGFLTIKFTDRRMIWIGIAVIAAGGLVLLVPTGAAGSLVGLLLIGLGCAPIYPCAIHATPGRFGADKSQAVIGVQMASAFIGFCVIPPLFGVFVGVLGEYIMPIILLALLVGVGVSDVRLEKAGRR